MPLTHRQAVSRMLQWVAYGAGKDGTPLYELEGDSRQRGYDTPEDLDLIRRAWRRGRATRRRLASTVKRRGSR